jgi:hypothetical protein
MANEAVTAVSAAWHTVIASSSPADGAFDAAAKTAIGATTLSATEELYPLLDFHLDISAAATAPTENATVDLYRIANANSAAAPTPAGSYKQQYVGSFVLNDQTGAQDYYIFGVANVDANDTFITQNNSGQTLTYLVAVRTRTIAPAA